MSSQLPNSGGSDDAWSPWVATRTPRRAVYHSLVVGRLREECLGTLALHALQPETSRLICRILARKLISIGRQPMLIAASTIGIDLHKWLFLLVTGRGE